MPTNRGTVGAETRSRRRKPRGRKSMGRGNSLADKRVGERCKLPQRGPGRSPGGKRVLMHLEPVYFKGIFTGRHCTPYIPLLSPLLSFFLYLPFPPCLSPSPNPFSRSFPFLATKQPPKILLDVCGCTVSSPSGVRGGAPAAYR